MFKTKTPLHILTARIKTALRDKYFGKHLEIRVRIFNLLSFAGVCLGIAVGASCLLTGAGVTSSVINFFAAAFAVFILRYANRSGQYSLCYLITVIVVFIAAFPVLFFTAGGYHSGMPSFFVFAVVFTVLMLEGKRMILMAVFETVLYAVCFVTAYLYPRTVTYFETELSEAADIFIGFAGAGLALITVILMHLQFYKDYNSLLDDKNKTLERLNKIKTEFLGSVSHELKAPLTVMSNFAQYSAMLLDDEPVNREELRGYMTDIMLEAERAGHIVHELLDVAACDTYGEIPLNKSPPFIPDIVGIVAKTHFPVMNGNGNTLVLSVPADLPEINADGERLLEVLINLVSNAAKNTVNGTVTISADSDAEKITVTISDTGKGMTREFADALLEDYPKTAGRQTSRNGLGLYFSDKVVIAHGGGLNIDSEPGKGTKVWFTLPMGGGTYGE